MATVAQILSHLSVIKNTDETYSYSGTKDFHEEPGDIRDLSVRRTSPRPRTRRSMNNSYS